MFKKLFDFWVKTVVLYVYFFKKTLGVYRYFKK